MLDILKREKLIKEFDNISNVEFKHFPSSTREWNNSIYLYNTNNLNLVPSSSISSMKLIKAFFNSYNKTLEKKMRSKRLLLRLRRLSSSKIYLSNGEFKHNNNSVLINLYVFNRQKFNYLSKLKSIYLNKILTSKNISIFLFKSLNLINKKSLDIIRKLNKDKHLFIKMLDTLEKNKGYKINTFKILSNYINVFHKNLINLSIKKLRLYFLYKQLIYINNSKINYSYLNILKKYLEKIYNKNIEFNIINLKRFYLNSDILSESIKLKLTRNKRKMRKILNKIKDKVKIHKKKLFLANITKYELNEIKNAKQLNTVVFNNLKYKHVTGFRIEAKGRLSRRFTASRSVSKLKYKGNLLDIDSSYRGISTVMLKGNLKSNIQYNKLESKTRIGSFGIKGWVSGN